MSENDIDVQLKEAKPKAHQRKPVPGFNVESLLPEEKKIEMELQKKDIEKRQSVANNIATYGRYVAISGLVLLSFVVLYKVYKSSFSRVVVPVKDEVINAVKDIDIIQNMK